MTCHISDVIFESRTIFEVSGATGNRDLDYEPKCQCTVASLLRSSLALATVDREREGERKD